MMKFDGGGGKSILHGGHASNSASLPKLAQVAVAQLLTHSALQCLQPTLAASLAAVQFAKTPWPAKPQASMKADL